MFVALRDAACCHTLLPTATGATAVLGTAYATGVTNVVLHTAAPATAVAMNIDQTCRCSRPINFNNEYVLCYLLDNTAFVSP